MDGSIPQSEFWGKLERNQDGTVTRWHPLIDHSVDVAIVLRSLMMLPAMRRSLQACTGTPLTDRHVSRLAVIGLLHDLGKCNTGFQAKRDKGSHTAGHVLETAGFFASQDRWPTEWLEAVESMVTWFSAGEETLQSMLLAGISHHGRPVSVADLENRGGDPARWWLPRQGLDPMQGVGELVVAARKIFPEAFEPSEPISAPPALQHRFAGLVMLADWIGSDVRYFPYRKDAREDRGAVALAGARRALSEIGLIAVPSQVDLARRAPPFAVAFGRNPYPLQDYMARELPIGNDSRLVLVESDTGSGKTEAALAWFLRLMAGGRVEGLYFALPTRVAAREIYGRVCRTIESAFPDPANRPSPVLLAVPGYAQVDGVAATLPDPRNRLWPDDPADARRESTWAAEHPKRFLAAPIAVGTIDQALLAGLQVKHAHLRSVCLDRHLLVVDEVHASEPYMREVLAQLLDRHCSRGGWALLLSATLGESARTHLLHQPIAPLEAARQRDYPLVSTLASRQAIASPLGRDKAVRVELIECLISPEVLLPRIADAVHRGARVLIVLNEVKRANALMRAAETNGAIPADKLFSVSGRVCPHHGRFARADREILDAAISARLGPQSDGEAVLVIGTQTLEQSLDIDADWLITDPCPMDVFLQRLGRLHRHPARRRPAAYERPHAVMMIPLGGDFAPFVATSGEARGPAGIGKVYSDLRMLQRSTEVLESRLNICIPRDNRLLVEDALHPEALSMLTSPAWRRHARYLEGSLLTELRQAEIGSLQEQAFGECQFRANDERIVTRLGANDRRARMPRPVTSPFGTAITELLVPGHLAPRAQAEEAEEVTTDAEGFGFLFGERRYRYSRFGLEKLDA